MFVFSMYIRRVGEDERIYKMSKYWHIFAWIYWFLVHISRVVAYYGWCVHAFATLALASTFFLRGKTIFLPIIPVY